MQGNWKQLKHIIILRHIGYLDINFSFLNTVMHILCYEDIFNQ